MLISSILSSVAIVLIAICAIAPTLAQEIDCREEFFRVSRREGSCVDFFVCMVGGRVDFSCDEGEIFDEERIACRPGDAVSCTFTIPEIPADACNNEFLRVNAHPDPDNCVDFFICMNYQIVQFRCGAGYIFDRHAMRCISGDQRTCREDDLVPYQLFLKNIMKA